MKKSKIVLLALCGICSQLTFADESLTIDDIESYNNDIIVTDSMPTEQNDELEQYQAEQNYQTQYNTYQENLATYKKQYAQYQKDLKKYNKDNEKAEKMKTQLNKKMMYACKTGQLDGVPPFACTQSIVSVYSKLYLYPAAEAKYNINLNPREPQVPMKPIAPVKSSL